MTEASAKWELDVDSFSAWPFFLVIAVPILFTLAILFFVGFFYFFFFGRMENSVLGNALEGVPEESEEEEQPSNSNIESANNLDGQY